MDPSLPKVTVELWRSDAVVPFDWLISVDLDAVPITHPAEKQAFTDVLTRLEHETDIPGVTRRKSMLPAKKSLATWLVIAPNAANECGPCRGVPRSASPLL